MYFKFIIINFFVGFFSDLVLNILSRNKYSPPSIRALYSYFKYYDSAFLTAVYAGLTIISVLILTMIASYTLLGFAEPKNKKQLLELTLLSFPFGYIADIIIYKYHIFGNSLDSFYKIAGAGLGGALSLIFSIVVSYFFL